MFKSNLSQDDASNSTTEHLSRWNTFMYFDGVAHWPSQRYSHRRRLCPRRPPPPMGVVASRHPACAQEHRTS